LPAAAIKSSMPCSIEARTSTAFLMASAGRSAVRCPLGQHRFQLAERAARRLDGFGQLLGRAGAGLLDHLGRLFDQVASFFHARFKHGVGLLTGLEGDLVQLIDAAAGGFDAGLDALGRP
jgi:hypothetical protein